MTLFLQLYLISSFSLTGVSDIRLAYFNAASDVNNMHVFWQKIEKYPKKDHIYYCYLAAYKSLQSKNETSLKEKMKFFNEFKTNIQKSFDLKDSFDARFVRYCVQHSTPSLLRYKGQMSGDKEYILKNLPSQTHTDYVKKVKAFLTSCSHLSHSEKQKVEKL